MTEDNNHMEFTETDQQLLDAFIESRYSKEQLKLLKERMANEAWRTQLNSYLQQEWQHAVATAKPASAPEEEKAWQAFINRIAMPEQAPVKRMFFLQWKRVAVAAAVILITAGVTWWRQAPIVNKAGDAVAATQKVWYSQPGKISHLILPDSSEVYLSGGATLSCNTSYGVDNRLLKLEGEAYFIANHHVPWPLTVQTGPVATVDVGTEFNIRYYKQLQHIEVAVARGKVEVHTSQTATAAAVTPLTQQQQLQYNAATGIYTTSQLQENTAVGGWRKGILLFQQQPLAEVAAALESYYGINIHISNTADKEMLITTAIENMPLKEAMEILSMTTGIAYTQKGSTIVFK